MLCYVVLFCVVLFYVMLCCVMLCCVVLCCVVLFCVVLFCFVLCCFVLTAEHRHLYCLKLLPLLYRHILLTTDMFVWISRRSTCYKHDKVHLCVTAEIFKTFVRSSQVRSISISVLFSPSILTRVPEDRDI